jgi:hypothetical protein
MTFPATKSSGNGVNLYAYMAQQRWQIGCIATFYGQNKKTVQLFSVTIMYLLYTCISVYIC